MTSLPAAVVLDREGRIAARIPGIAQRGTSSLGSVLAGLRAEPAPALAAPSAPRGMWFLRGRAPAAPDQTPRAVWAVLSAGGRAWRFGPSAAGDYVVTALGRSGPGRWGLAVASGTSPDVEGGTMFMSPNVDNARHLGSQPVIVAGLADAGQRSRRVYLVRPGYTRAVIAGRAWPIRDQVLTWRGGKAPTRMVLEGPGKRRLVLDAATHAL